MVVVVRLGLLRRLVEALGVGERVCGWLGETEWILLPVLNPWLAEKAPGAVRDVEGVSWRERVLLERALEIALAGLERAREDPSGFGSALGEAIEGYEAAGNMNVTYPDSGRGGEFYALAAWKMLGYVPVPAWRGRSERVVVFAEKPEGGEAGLRGLEFDRESAARAVALGLLAAWRLADEGAAEFRLGPAWDVYGHAYTRLRPGDREPPKHPGVLELAKALSRAAGRLGYRVSEARLGLCHAHGYEASADLDFKLEGGRLGEARVSVRLESQVRSLQLPPETDVMIDVSSVRGIRRGWMRGKFSAGVQASGDGRLAAEPAPPSWSYVARLAAERVSRALPRLEGCVAAALKAAEPYRLLVLKLGAEPSERHAAGCGGDQDELYGSVEGFSEAVLGFRLMGWSVSVCVSCRGKRRIRLAPPYPRGSREAAATLALAELCAWAGGLETHWEPGEDDDDRPTEALVVRHGRAPPLWLFKTLGGVSRAAAKLAATEPPMGPPEVAAYAAMYLHPTLSHLAERLLAADSGRLSGALGIPRPDREPPGSWLHRLTLEAAAKAASAGALRPDPWRRRLLVRLAGEWVGLAKAIPRLLEERLRGAGAPEVCVRRLGRLLLTAAAEAEARAYIAVARGAAEVKPSPEKALAVLRAAAEAWGAPGAAALVVSSSPHEPPIAWLGYPLHEAMRPLKVVFAEYLEARGVEALAREAQVSSFRDGRYYWSVTSLAAAAAGGEAAAAAVLRDVWRGELRGEKLWGALQGVRVAWPTVAAGLAAQLDPWLLERWLEPVEVEALEPAPRVEPGGKTPRGVWPAIVNGSHLLALAASPVKIVNPILVAPAGGSGSRVYVVYELRAAFLALKLGRRASEMLHAAALAEWRRAGGRPLELAGGSYLALCPGRRPASLDCEEILLPEAGKVNALKITEGYVKSFAGKR